MKKFKDISGCTRNCILAVAIILLGLPSLFLTSAAQVHGATRDCAAEAVACRGPVVNCAVHAGTQEMYMCQVRVEQLKMKCDAEFTACMKATYPLANHTNSDCKSACAAAYGTCETGRMNKLAACKVNPTATMCSRPDMAHDYCSKIRTTCENACGN